MRNFLRKFYSVIENMQKAVKKKTQNSRYDLLRSRLLLNGISLHRWALDRGYPPMTV